MSYQVKVLYDFSGEPNTAELSIVANEILTVFRDDVGEGWWEGLNSKGETGLFPANYVEVISSKEPSKPPPILSPVDLLPPGNRYDHTADDWSEQPSAPSNYARADGDTWDDDWDDDTYSEIGPSPPQSQSHPNPAKKQEAPSYPLPGMPVNENQEDVHTNLSYSGTVTKKNIARFSNFAKSGGDGYILGTLKVPVMDSDKVYIQNVDDMYYWANPSDNYKVLVASPKKETKFKGIKSFIAYQLTPSFNNIQVSRRYKHFDWLHERLTVKFCLIPIPPLPDKQISGRYEEQFVEHRRIQLQEFVDWVCRHPVLSRCDVWEHFLTCTDDKRWKAGKRQAEKDQLVGANYFITIFPPEKNLLASYVDQNIEQCFNFTHHMDSAVKILMATSIDQTKKHQGHYKREFQKIGESFFSFGNALGYDESPHAPSVLTTAIKMTGCAYIEIGRMFEDQPRLDWQPLSDKLHLYKGIIGSYPDVLAVQKGAVLKRKECEKLTSDSKMEMVQLTEVSRRTDVITYALLSEINHFRSERSSDLSSAMQEFLKHQIQFYKNIVSKLESTLQLYEGQ